MPDLDFDRIPEVMLLGTCNNSQWREDLVIPFLTIDYFNPVLPPGKPWTDVEEKLENEKKNTCDFLLYVITPKMTGPYAIAEATRDSCKRPDKTVICFLDGDEGLIWTEDQKRSVRGVKSLCRAEGAHVFDTIQETIDFLNSQV